MHVKLTAAERRWVEWALDAMPDYFDELVEEGELPEAPEIPSVRDGVLDTEDRAVIDDLISRIRTQAPDVVADENQGDPARMASKLRVVAGLLQKLLEADS